MKGLSKVSSSKLPSEPSSEFSPYRTYLRFPLRLSPGVGRSVGRYPHLFARNGPFCKLRAGSCGLSIESTNISSLFCHFRNSALRILSSRSKSGSVEEKKTGTRSGRPSMHRRSNVHYRSKRAFSCGNTKVQIESSSLACFNHRLY